MPRGIEMKTRAAITFLLAGIAATAIAVPARADEEFYKGKTINLYIGYGPGAFDNYGRLLARHYTKHVPGHPAIIVRTMPGAATLTLANHLYNVAPKDGTVFGSVHERIGIEPLYGEYPTKYDSLKFNWIGSIHSQTLTCVAWHTAKVKSLQDAMTTEIVMGASGVSGDSHIGPHVLNSLLGTKMKIISGYSTTDGTDVFLAMERGEVDGRCIGWAGLKTTVPQWVPEKKINVLVQLATKRNPDLPDVPMVTDLVTDEGAKKALTLLFGTQAMGRPYVAPPDIPADRVATMRKAFDDTMKDPEFLAEADARKFEIDPLSGQDIHKLLKELFASPKDVVDRVAAFRNAGQKK